MKTISIVTVTYNAAKTLQKTLLSITSQTVFDQQVEFIVIDGGSKDNTLELLEPFRPAIAHLVSESDCGIFDAMNKGAQFATAPWIIFMNAGDEFYDNHTIESLHLERQHPDHVIYGDCIRIWTDGHRETRMANPFFRDPNRISGIGICHQSTYVPTRMLIAHPFEWKRFPHCADFKLLHDLWKEEVRFEYVPRPLCLYAYGDGFSSDQRHIYQIFDENARVMHLRYSLTYYKQRIRMALSRLYARLASSNAKP